MSTIHTLLRSCQRVSKCINFSIVLILSAFLIAKWKWRLCCPLLGNFSWKQQKWKEVPFGDHFDLRKLEKTSRVDEDDFTETTGYESSDEVVENGIETSSTTNCSLGSSSDMSFDIAKIEPPKSVVERFANRIREKRIKALEDEYRRQNLIMKEAQKNESLNPIFKDLDRDIDEESWKNLTRKEKEQYNIIRLDYLMREKRKKRREEREKQKKSMAELNESIKEMPLYKDLKKKLQKDKEKRKNMRKAGLIRLSKSKAIKVIEARISKSSNTSINDFHAGDIVLFKNIVGDSFGANGYEWIETKVIDVNSFDNTLNLDIGPHVHIESVWPYPTRKEWSKLKYDEVKETMDKKLTHKNGRSDSDEVESIRKRLRGGSAEVIKDVPDDISQAVGIEDQEDLFNKIQSLTSGSKAGKKFLRELKKGETRRKPEPKKIKRKEYLLNGKNVSQRVAEKITYLGGQRFLDKRASKKTWDTEKQTREWRKEALISQSKDRSIPSRERRYARKQLHELSNIRQKKQGKIPYAMAKGMALKKEARKEKQEEFEWMTGITQRKGLGKKKKRERAKIKDWGLRELGSRFSRGVLKLDKSDIQIGSGSRKRTRLSIPTLPKSMGE